MRLPDIELERFFARWDFAVSHLLCASDLEAGRLPDLLALADPEARALWYGLSLGYTESPGDPLLRAEIASLYERAAPEDVLVLSGAEESIFAFFRSVLGPGDHAVVAWPAYQSLHLLPGTLFGYPGDHFRLGFGRSGFAEGLERLDTFSRRRLGA